MLPVSAVEKTQSKSSSSIPVYNSKKNKNRDTPSLTASQKSKANNEQEWPWPGYHKDGYKLNYDDEIEVEEKVECTPQAMNKIKELNKGIEDFISVGNEIKGGAGDVRNKRALRNMVGRLQENQNSLVSLELPKYAKYYQACKMSPPDYGAYPLHILTDGHK